MLAAATSWARVRRAGPPPGCRLAGVGPSPLGAVGPPRGRPDCVHLHQAKVSSHAGYLLNQHGSMLGVSPDRIVVTCEPGSRQQVQTIVQLIPKCHHHHHLQFLCAGTN